MSANKFIINNGGTGGLVVPRLATDPVTAMTGEIYFNTATNKFRSYTGTVWEENVDLNIVGQANGIATLDSGGKVPVSQLPNSIMEYLGTWSAATNTPTLTNGIGNPGDVYINTAAGSVDFGAGAITFAIGDWVIYSGSIWQKSINSNSVASVNGFTGVVVLSTSHIAEGTNLYFTDERAQDAAGAMATSSSKVSLTYSDVSNTLTPDIVAGSLVNADINAGANIARTKLSALTANRALVTDGSGFDSVSATTATEIGYVAGVTSSIQAQLNATLSNPMTTGGDIIYGGAAGVATRLANGTFGQVLTSSGSTVAPTWQTPNIVNYIINSDAELNTTGYAAYKNTAQSTPVTGSGGSPTITITRTTSTPLSGSGSFLITKSASNLQGEGISYDFTIAECDKGRPLQISMPYQIASGTYSGGTQSTDSDLCVYIYDVTNNQLIQPSGFKMDGGVIGINYNVKGSFQSNSNSTSYRLIWHVATTNTSAWTLKFDNVSVGPIVTTNGAAMTDWVDFPSVAYGSLWTSTGTASAYGTTVVTNKAQWRRVGSNMEIRHDFYQSNAGTAGTGGNLFNLPPGYSIDTTKTPANTTIAASAAAVGSNVGFFQLSAGTATGIVGGVEVYDATRLKIIELTATSAAGGAGGGYFGGSGYTGFGVTTAFSFFASVPIAGWSSNSVVSSDTDTRVCYASARVGTGASTTNGVPINFDVVETDSHGAITTGVGTWRFTAPIPGIYEVAAGLHTNVGNAGVLYKNGSIFRYILRNDASGAFGNGSTQVPLQAGEYVDVRLAVTATPVATSVVGGTVATLNFISIKRLSGPSQIAASETIAAKYYASANFAATASVPINFDTKVHDTHSAVTPSATAWRFTAPASRTYNIGGFMQASAGVGASVILYKNGSASEMISTYNVNYANGAPNMDIRLLAGEYIDIRPTTSVTFLGGTPGTGSVAQICIKSIGGY